MLKFRTFQKRLEQRERAAGMVLLQGQVHLW